jgi:hypothetical protein
MGASPDFANIRLLQRWPVHAAEHPLWIQLRVGNPDMFRDIAKKRRAFLQFLQ